jgi:SAM-dependent methyltransferase
VDRLNLPYWNSLAGGWTVSPPLAPAPEDLAWFQGAIDRLGRRPLRALLLGVTPGLARLRWPEGTSLVALDWSARMLGSVLPRTGTPDRTWAVQADWRELPLADQSCDVIVGDGCYTALGDRLSAELMNREMHRVLRPGGLACFRCFASHPRVPPVEDLLGSVSGGDRIPLDLFRWQLAIAVQGARWGVSLGEVWAAWHSRVTDGPALAERQGWTAAELNRVERWKNERARYAFPSLDDLRSLAAAHFELVDAEVPSYSLGDCFPRVILRRRAKGL